MRSLPSTSSAQLGEGPPPVLGARLGDAALERLALLSAAAAPSAWRSRPRRAAGTRLRGCPSVPAAHRLAVFRRRRSHDRRGAPPPPQPRSRPASEKLATSRFTIPLPRPGQRLVEVVEVEDEPPLGRGEGAEVGEMGVAAELRLEARPRGPREIRRHHRRGAAVEGERRGQHAAVAQRHQLAHPRAGLLLEQLDRVGTRPAAGSHSPWLERGAAERAALPAAARSAGDPICRRRSAISQTVTGSASGGSGPACSSSKRCVGRRRVVQNEARTRKAAKRKAIFSAFSCASS